jgi:tetratricopeptide (TPR) repeat protein
VKLAAAEAHFVTEAGAPLSIGGIPDVATRTRRFALEIPYGLSVMAYNDPNAVVRGLNDFPQDEWPPVTIVHIAFQVMVGCGTAMLVLVAWVALRRVRKQAGRRAGDPNQLDLFLPPPARIESFAPAMSTFEQALLCDEHGDDRAAELYAKAIESQDCAADALCNLGIIESKKGNTAKAFDCFTTSLKQDPRHLEAHYNLANLYYDAGDLQLAKLHYEAAARIEPGFALVYFNLSLVYHKLGDLEAASTTLEKYRELEPEDEEQDYQATVAYQGAMAYIYLADRSTCPQPGQRCDWRRAPRLEEDVLEVARAFHHVNETGEPIPQLAGTLDLIFAREPKPVGEAAGPFKVFDGQKLVPVAEYLQKHPRQDLLRLEERLEGLAAGPHGHRAGDILLLARSGVERPVEERFYFSNVYRSWHGSPTSQDSRIPLLVARKNDSGDRIHKLVQKVVGANPSQLHFVPLMKELMK